VRKSAGLQYPLDLPHHPVRIRDMFQHRIALHPLEQVIAKWKQRGIRRNIHPSHGKQVQIHIPVHEAPGPADVQVPTTQRRINLLIRIRYERLRRTQRARNPIPPTARMPLRVQPLDRLLTFRRHYLITRSRTLRNNTQLY